MHQLGDRLHLTLEALQAGWTVEHLLVEHFQGDDAFHATVPGLEDRAHAAGAQFGKHHIIAHDQLGDLAIEDTGHLEGGEFAGHRQDLQGRLGTPSESRVGNFGKSLFDLQRAYHLIVQELADNRYLRCFHGN